MPGKSIAVQIILTVTSQAHSFLCCKVDENCVDWNSQGARFAHMFSLIPMDFL